MSAVLTTATLQLLHVFGAHRFCTKTASLPWFLVRPRPLLFSRANPTKTYLAPP